MFHIRQQGHWIVVDCSKLQILGALSALVSPSSALQKLHHVHFSVDTCSINWKLASIILGFHISSSI